MTDDVEGRSEIEQAPAEEQPPVEADEQAFDLFALRSFRFSVEAQTEAVGRTVGWWTDGRARVWRPPAYDRKTEDWLDGTCTAVCYAYGSKPRHKAPDEKCGCGIYASLSYADLLGNFRKYTNHLVVVIAAEGTTIIGNRGLRTEFARVVAYWASPASPGGVRVGAEPSYREVAEAQFKDAQAFDTPMDMIDTYDIALVPPADVQTRRSNTSRYWA